MFGNKKEGVITFYYESNDLFNDVGILSAYLAKNIMAESAVDKYSITDDEKELYEACLKQAVPNIYEAMLKMTSGVENAFDTNVLVTSKEDGIERNTGTYVEFSIVDAGGYNKNVLSIVDTTLNTCLKYGILAEFYSICLNADLYRIAQDRFTNSLFNLKQRMFQLKKRTTYSELA